MIKRRVIVVQPSVPRYRIGFYARIAETLGETFQVYGSNEDLGVLSARDELFDWERPLGPIKELVPGFYWQEGARRIDVAPKDILVISGAPRCLSNLVLLLVSKLKGARVIWWGHYWSSTSRPWRAKLRWLAMRLADGILFYTDREVEECGLTHKDGFKVIRSLNNGIETDEIVQLRAPYVLTSRPRDILFVGRITQKARLELLLRALAIPKCSGLLLDVIGDGVEHAALQRLSLELGISERVSWHDGLADESHIAKIANSCKVFVYPGSVGLSLIHGLSYGLPAVVHDNRWEHMPEFSALRVGANGMTFKQGDVASLADTIQSLLESPKALSEMSSCAVATISKSFNSADMAKRFLSLIESVGGYQEASDSNGSDFGAMSREVGSGEFKK